MKWIVVSDIHANGRALEAVVADVESRYGDGAFQYWFLGDFVGYGGDVVACARWLDEQIATGAQWVAGNHDEYWALNSVAGNANTRAKLSIAHHEMQLKRRLPAESERLRQQVQQMYADNSHARRVELFGNLAATFVHASLSPSLLRSHYVYPWIKDLPIEFDLLSSVVPQVEMTVVSFHGHTHYPMWVRRQGDAICFETIRYDEPQPLGSGKMLVNPGSVGQPRDGDARAAYTVLDTDARCLTFHRVEYDKEGAALELKRCLADWKRIWWKRAVEQARAHGAVVDQAKITQEVRNAIEQLQELLLTANGGRDLQLFETKYKRQAWGLEAIN